MVDDGQRAGQQTSSYLGNEYTGLHLTALELRMLEETGGIRNTYQEQGIPAIEGNKHQFLSIAVVAKIQQ